MIANMLKNKYCNSNILVKYNKLKEIYMFFPLFNSTNIKQIFSEYPQGHILFNLYNASLQTTPLTAHSNRFIQSIENNRMTFIMNFERNVSFFNEKFSLDSTYNLLSEYLSVPEHSDFIFRYSNLILLNHIILLQNNISGICINTASSNHHSITLTTNSLKSINISFIKYDINKYIEQILKSKDLVELEIGLKPSEFEDFQYLLKLKGFSLVESKVSHISNMIKLVNANTPNYASSINYVCLQLSSSAEENYNIHSISGLLGNMSTGLLKTTTLHKDFDISLDVLKNISSILVYRNNYESIINGTILPLLANNYSNKIKNLFSKSVYHERDYLEMFQEFEENNPVCIYNSQSMNIANYANVCIHKYISHYSLSEDSNYIFEEYQKIMITSFIEKCLQENPHLIVPFHLDENIAIQKIYEQYIILKKVVSATYPSDHIFQHTEFLFDAMCFTITYCMFIVPTYLHNEDMMSDLINRKLKCDVKNHFDLKLFNEAYSEFQIFLYLFFSIFCFSDEYLTFKSLQYEPNGNLNKRFEYAFVLESGLKINIEVKALECAPEYSDNIDILKEKDGQQYYKNYFHAYSETDTVPEYIRLNSKKLKSNYRQVSKNIKKICEKCPIENNVVNLGFIMINYGTSREEFISYLMNPEQGYLIKQPLNKVDAIILFSMCPLTDLLMTNIKKYEHLFVFPSAKADLSFLKKLRLDNFVFNSPKCDYSHIFSEKYGIYECINRKGLLTIQMKYDNEKYVDDYSEKIKFMNEQNRIISALYQK